MAGDVATTRDFATEVDVGGDREVRQLATAFSEMLALLDASREQQYRLVHDAGHELRTQLTSLCAKAALLDRFDRLDDGDRQAVMEAVNDELVEVGDLVDELIDLATDQQDAPFTFVDLDLDDLVRGVVSRWERRTD